MRKFMTINHIAFASLAVLVALLAGCSDEEPLPLAPPTFSHGGGHTISGDVLGPNGFSICDRFPDGSLVRVVVIDPVNATPETVFAGTQNLFCPNNAFSIPVELGTYRLRVQLPASLTNIGNLPWRHLEPGDVVVDGGSVVQDIQVLDGVPLGGSATIDGSPIVGVSLALLYDFEAPQTFGPTFGSSGADGAWDEFFGRSPMTIQAGVRYRVRSGCLLLGTRALVGPPTGGFLFPDEVSAINCILETAPAAEFSHDATRLVVTPMPGDIGGLSGELNDEFGFGWGVQFPIDASETPVQGPISQSHLFRGGLLIGVEPDVVLAGINIGDFGLQCTGPCRDLGLDGTVKARNKVKWKYSDALSPEGVGLKVVQESFGGRPPADYVLFKYDIENTSGSTLTFYAGFFGDWDVDEAFTDDVGFTNLGGRLMYMTSTNPNDRGTFVGTVLLGNAPVSGTLFFNNSTIPESLSDQMDALSGAVTRQTIGPGDNRVIHALGPITLRRDEKAKFWIAIVAGEDATQLLANAEAAAAHVKVVLEPPDTPDEFSIDAISPGSGPVGTEVTITGTNLLQTDWPLDLLVGDVEIADLFIDLVTASQVTFRAPNIGAAGTYDARVRLGGTRLGATESNVVTWEQIGADEPGEPANDDSLTAPVVTFPLDFVGSFHDGDVNDFYRFTLNETSTLEITLDWDQGGRDIDVLVVDGAFTMFVCFQGATLQKPETATCDLAAGDYVLWVNDFSADLSLVSYRLIADIP